MKITRDQHLKIISGLAAARSERDGWYQHWQELATFILPRRYRWLVAPNQWSRGSPINRAIVDSTGTTAARTCASGMMSGITSPTRPWFKLSIAGNAPNRTSTPVSLWLEECESRMRRVFAESNFYNAVAVMYHDLAVFGSACMIIYEDFDDVIRCYNPCVGEFFFATSSRGSVDTVYREFTYTIRQVVERFGKENCSLEVRKAFEAGGASASNELVVCHALQPKAAGITGVPSSSKYVDVYWEKGKENGEVLEVRGYKEFIAMCPRWDVSGNDSYGRSPGMEALGDIKQLQQETKRKAEAIDKMVRPPMVADVQLKNQPASLLPGGITYVTGNSAGYKPAFQVQPDIQGLMLDIQEVQQRIRTVFFNDLFMMISQLNTVRSATEIDARREEKLIMLGPVLERIENEGLDPGVSRVFNIMMRGGLLPEPPEELAQQNIEIQYVSMLAEAQKASSTAGIERLLGLTGNMAGIYPQVVDIVMFDELVSEYAKQLSVSPKLIRDVLEAQQLRAERAKKEQMLEQLQMGYGAAKGAEVLSKTDVGGGQNALSTMMGG